MLYFTTRALFRAGQHLSHMFYRLSAFISLRVQLWWAVFDPSHCYTNHKAPFVLQIFSHPRCCLSGWATNIPKFAQYLSSQVYVRDHGVKTECYHSLFFWILLFLGMSKLIREGGIIIFFYKDYNIVFKTALNQSDSVYGLSNSKWFHLINTMKWKQNIDKSK